MNTLVPSSEAHGDIFVLARTHSRHFSSVRGIDARVMGIEPQSTFATRFPTGIGGETAPLSEAPPTKFRDQLVAELTDVNRAQQEYESLVLQAVTEPDSVEAHDISIASARARMTLDIAKNVVDRVIQAYQTITNLR